MTEWLRKYWWVLILGVGGIMLLLYLKNRQAANTGQAGTNALGITLPSFLGGGGGTSFSPAVNQPASVNQQPAQPVTVSQRNPLNLPIEFLPGGEAYGRGQFLWGQFSPEQQAIAENAYTSEIFTTNPFSIGVRGGYIYAPPNPTFAAPY